jgi:indole-3-glycerol phosphate synthase
MSAAARGILAEIIAGTRRELQARKRELPPEALAERLARLQRQGCVRPAGAFRAALAGQQLALIAEIKRRAPSAGNLRGELEAGALAASYASAGASALSVLTEAAHFGGCLADLKAARSAAALPLLRKDFIVDPYQLLEARLAGADAVLLIAAALSGRQLAELLAQAQAAGLDALVEVHDHAQLERALDAGAAIIGINNRDLRDFSVDLKRTFELVPSVPPGRLIVSESGIGSAEQLVELRRAGVDAALIGSSLMRAPDPARALAQLLEALGRSPAPEGSSAGASG